MIWTMLIFSQNLKSSHQEALWCVFEENEAAIKMIVKGRSPTMRHVSRTHRVTLDWLFDGIYLDSKIQIKYIDIKNQLADTLTKTIFTRDEWNHLLRLKNISHSSSTKESDGERVTAKQKLMMNLVSRCLSLLHQKTWEESDMKIFYLRARELSSI